MRCKGKLLFVIILLVFEGVLSFGKAQKIRLVMQDFTADNPIIAEFTEILESEFHEWSGIEIDLEPISVPRETYSQNLNLLIMGGDIPDIIWFRDDGDLIWASQGLLMDLRPFVENSDVFQKNMNPWNMQRLENYPYILAIFPLNLKIGVTKLEWLEELNIVVPEDRPMTIDEYYLMLKKFTQKGKYGITVAGSPGGLTELDWIFSSAFGIEKQWIKNDNGDYVYSHVTPKRKEQLVFYRKLYQEGILDPEFLTTNWQRKEDKFYSGEVGMIVGTSGIVIDLYADRMKKIGDGTTVIPLVPPSGPYGDAGFLAVNLYKEPRGFAIPVTSKVSDTAFKFLEFMASDEGQFLDWFGVEGIHYIKKNDQIEKTQEEWWPFFFEGTKWESPVPLLGNAGAKSLEICEKYYTGDNYFPMPQEYATLWDAMNVLEREYSAKIVTGQFELDKFDEFVEKWYEAGGETYTQLANEYFKSREVK